jgi:hypothetical protein
MDGARTLPDPHVCNDYEICRERDADLYILGEAFTNPGSVLCSCASCSAANANGPPDLSTANRAEYLASEPEPRSWPMTRSFTKESALLGAA